MSVYTGHNWTLYNADCREITPTLDLSRVGVIITDPPYGINHPCDYANRGRSNAAKCNDYPQITGDAESFDPSWLLALDKPMVPWGANHYANRLPPSGGWLVWDKERPDTLDQATCELAWTNCIKGVRRFRHLWNGMMRASENGPLVHPMQKPVALTAWILGLRWTPPGAVFDPYAGSGSVGVAAVRAGREYIGCELSPEYAAITKARLEDAARQPDMFASEVPA